MNKSDLKNGMIVTLRMGAQRVVIGETLLSCDVIICNTLDNYTDGLTHINNYNSEDIMKIEYGGKVIWERKVEWRNVPFGTKVICWNEDDETKNVGKFLAYDNDDTELPFFIFLEQDMRATWFRRCELLEEEEC